jgi:hydrogenase maturation protein HypF
MTVLRAQQSMGKMPAAADCAVRLRITGIVQGVGFRPFVYRVAKENGIAGWVLNGADGVDVRAEASADAIARFVGTVRTQPPPAAQIASFDVSPVAVAGYESFEIRTSERAGKPTVRISPDLAVCQACLRELFDPGDRRYRYPYINCTDCGPRHSIVLELPYDRPSTTMREWPMCERCAAEYEDPHNRRFHAQPIACHACGPGYVLRHGDFKTHSVVSSNAGEPPPSAASNVSNVTAGYAAIELTAQVLRAGAIVAIKGIGGYHLVCDARNAESVDLLRARKFRKERPFALMARDLGVARTLIELDASAETILSSSARPIVLGAARTHFAAVAPDNAELGVMLPYAPLHHLLFAAGAPETLVMTSANRSSEPIAYEDEDALQTLAGIADAFLIGERRIARRIDDSIVRTFSSPANGHVETRVPAVLRRSRGFAPRVVASVPSTRPILALGGDLKNAIALVVAGEVVVGGHIGDLDHYSARIAFEAAIGDLCGMYGVRLEDCAIACDAHPGYVSSIHATTLPGTLVPVQHHRAHVASVIAERAAWDTEVLGIAFDGTGYGDDGTIWGGEVFVGSVRRGFERATHLRPAPLPGGDAAARFPVQAAAGFLSEVPEITGLCDAPFYFPERYVAALATIERGVRTFRTTSFGRLFDTVAALCGFVREMTFEGQAAMWLEQLAVSCGSVAFPTSDASIKSDASIRDASARNDAYRLPLVEGTLDYRPLLADIVRDRIAGRDPGAVARGFHLAVVRAVVDLAKAFAGLPVVVSGGVFQNRLLLEMLRGELGDRLWTNASVPPNDGGICLGQAALAAFALAPKFSGQ